MEQKNFYDEYLISIEENMQRNYTYIQFYPVIIRLIDIFMAVLGIIITFPIVFVFSIAIKIETPGPIFYLQERVGYNGVYFKVIKLRSMGIDAEKNGAQWADKNDPRVTQIGGFIRKTRIDELPQLINVLRGEMSMVGPRPERPVFTAEFNEQHPGFVERLMVKPGITGWAQVNGGYDISPKAKLEFDLFYIENRTLLLDFKIILKTVRIVISGEGAR